MTGDSDTTEASGRLASSIAELRPYYDVVVIGSGYGGAVTAAGIARRDGDMTVCVLERGRELRPGDYPDTLVKAMRDFQIDLPGRHLFSPTALYDLRVNHDMNVFVGCGLGGTSLINASVAIKPPSHVFADHRWPQRLRDDNETLDRAFETATEMLRPSAYPCEQPPRKFLQLAEIAARMPGRHQPPATAGATVTRSGRLAPERAPVTILFPQANGDWGRRTNHAGVMQQPCNGCGDCVSGCNFGAKSTLLQNYLPVARQARVQMFTEMKVRSIEPWPSRGDRTRWIVWFDYLGGSRGRFRAPRPFITARTVVLAAGALGSTEILLRSRRSVWLSKQLGHSFSGNGDVLGFAYNARNAVNAIGGGARSLQGLEPPGPCITGMVRAVDLDLKKEFLLQEGAIPGALSPILAVGFVLARIWRGTDTARHKSRQARAPSLWRIADDYLRGGVSSTQTFLGMVDDDDVGQLTLSRDRVRVRWAGAGRSAVYRSIEQALTTATGSPGVDGVYVRSPFGNVTVHPLGGCVMAENGAAGVVDDTGAVFAGTGTETYPGLYVCDGAIIPRALIANPLLAISALAERAAPHILEATR